MYQSETADPKIFGALLLDIGIGLLRAGASGRRIRNTLANISTAYQYSLHLDLGPKSISISLLNNTAYTVFNGTRTVNSYGVDFKIISAINRLNESISRKAIPLAEVRAEVDRGLKLPHHPRLLILFAVSIAGAAFCYTFGGELAEMIVTFGATFAGLFAKQELQKRVNNPYVCTFISALVAALFTGLFYLIYSSMRLEHAYATCTLFLIPGVPLLNSIIDLIDGNIIYGLERGVNAMIHAFAIALAMSITLLIYNVHG